MRVISASGVMMLPQYVLSGALLGKPLSCGRKGTRDDGPHHPEVAGPGIAMGINKEIGKAIRLRLIVCHAKGTTSLICLSCFYRVVKRSSGTGIERKRRSKRT